MLQFTEQPWVVSRSAMFRRTTDEFGGFSNMSKQYPLIISGIRIGSTEHLYQAMRFTGDAEIQKLVIEANTPMSAKQKSREWDSLTRSDWMEIRVDVMRWVLQIKLAQHIKTFGSLLLKSRTRQIVEWSKRDSFWGAGPVDEWNLHGCNILGQLLSELRDSFQDDPESIRTVPAPAFPEPLLYGVEIKHLHPSDSDN